MKRFFFCVYTFFKYFHLVHSLKTSEFLFIADVVQKAHKHNVKLVLSPDRTVPLLDDHGQQVNGYFSDVPPVFAVATGQPTDRWFEIFIHESCHFDQWIENSPYWIDDNGTDQWLNDRAADVPETPEETALGFKQIRDIESDCERRVVDKIIKYELPIDVQLYAQRGNAYVYFYHHLQLTGKWYTAGNEPYLNPCILSQMPTVMYPVEHYDVFPEQYKQLFAQYYE